MTWYRCRAEIGDGGYVSYIGPSIREALDAMAKHVAAHTVVVERMGEYGNWDFVVAGIWRQKKERTHGLLATADRVLADLDAVGVDRGLDHEQPDDSGV